MQPVIIFDIDGTLTNYRGFINKVAVPYFEKHYGIKPVFPDEIEIRDIFDLSNKFPDKESKILDKFWISHRFFRFTLVDRYRRDTVSYINALRKKGFRVELHSSREKTCEKSLIGMIARTFTVLQCWFSGAFIPRKNIKFYKNDDLKALGIISTKPILVFDDKETLIKKYADQGICSCFCGGKKTPEKYSNNVVYISDFDQVNIANAYANLFTKNNWNIIEREAASDRFFRHMIHFGVMIRLLFKPILLNEPMIKEDGPTIYAPNHVKTVDPLVLESVLKEHIHWVALKRFFDGKDSIFNNSKNPLLCKITQKIFSKLDYFPIERKQDNIKVNNFRSIKEMYRFLINGFNVGIFPEGTTRKESGLFFGNFDKGFAELAVKSNATVQPILIFWAKRPVIYFGQVIESKGMDSEEIFEKYIHIQHDSLSVCRNYVNSCDPSCRKDADDAERED